MEAPEIPEFPQFVHETVTRWSDDDSQGVLNNAVYLTLFEEARHGFSRAAEVLIEGAFPFLLAQTNVRFVAPGRGGESVRVELSTVHVGTRSFRQAYRVRSAGARSGPKARPPLCATTPTRWSPPRSPLTSGMPSTP